MPLSEKQKALLTDIQHEWNRAEQDIKVAEQVVSNIVIPAIKELRYGGRRVIDALAIIVQDGDIITIESLLHDARFDCHRARHDAIDAATAKIAIDMQIMTERLGHDAVLTAFPKFGELYADLTLVREKIALSRKERDNREAIYSTIESVDFPALVKVFVQMKTCEPVMIALAKKGRTNSFLGRWGAIRWGRRMCALCSWDLARVFSLRLPIVPGRQISRLWLGR